MTAPFNLPMKTTRVHLGWSEISSGGGTTGFPWSGYVEHWRDLDDENIIRYIYYQAGKLGSVRHRPDNPEAVRLHSLELNLNAARGNSLPSQSLNAGGEL